MFFACGILPHNNWNRLFSCSQPQKCVSPNNIKAELNLAIQKLGIFQRQVNRVQARRTFLPAFRPCGRLMACGILLAEMTNDSSGNCPLCCIRLRTEPRRQLVRKFYKLSMRAAAPLPTRCLRRHPSRVLRIDWSVIFYSDRYYSSAMVEDGER